MTAEMTFIITDRAEIPGLSDSIKFSIIVLGIAHLRRSRLQNRCRGIERTDSKIQRSVHVKVQNLHTSDLEVRHGLRGARVSNP
jgi:hypothetical protein